jgi:drug/metabolite transporter (DMT)-like permease
LVLSYASLRVAKVAPFGMHRPMLIFRGVLGFLGLSSVYYAATHLPLADATVIQYLYPPLTLLIASVFLREPMDRKVFVSMLLGVAGLVLVAQPAAVFGRIAAPLDPRGLTAAFLGAFFSACAYVTVRTLGKAEHSLVIVFYFPLVAFPASLVTLGPEVVWPEGIEWCWLLLLGLSTQVGQVAVTRGYASAPAGRMAVYSYVQVLFAGVWGVLLFHERPSSLTLAGGALILAGALFNLRA